VLLPAAALLVLNAAATALVLYVNRKVRAEADRKKELQDTFRRLKSYKQQLQIELGRVRGGLTGELLLAAELLALPVKPVVVLSHPQGAWQGAGEEDCPVLHLSNLLRYILHELLEDYPELETEDIQAVLLYAAERVGEERVFLVDAGN